MSPVLRAASKPAFAVARPLSSSNFTQYRRFHSPFAALGKSQLQSSTTHSSSQVQSSVYEKQLDASPEPILSHSGTRTYVVSEPDSKFYSVPSGAYSNSAPYKNPADVTSQDLRKGTL